jgi:hypothetical protein
MLTRLSRLVVARVSRVVQLLRLDTVPKFVQLIKLGQDMVGMGRRRVRPPRVELVGSELEDAQRLIRYVLDHRPAGRPASTKHRQRVLCSQQAAVSFMGPTAVCCWLVPIASADS